MQYESSLRFMNKWITRPLKALFTFLHKWLTYLPLAAFLCLIVYTVLVWTRLGYLPAYNGINPEFTRLEKIFGEVGVYGSLLIIVCVVPFGIVVTIFSKWVFIGFSINKSSVIALISGIGLLIAYNYIFSDFIAWTMD